MKLPVLVIVTAPILIVDFIYICKYLHGPNNYNKYMYKKSFVHGLKVRFSDSLGLL